jgi:hypothetical protein
MLNPINYLDFIYFFVCNLMILRSSTKIGLVGYTLLEIVYVHYQRI